MSTTRHHNLSLVYAIGIPTVIAIGSCFISIFWIAGNWAYSTYLKPKIEVVEVPESRKELEARYRELLDKSGFKSDVNLKSLSDKELKAANYKLEMALRSGKQ